MCSIRLEACKKFDFKLVTYWAPNIRRLVETDSCSDRHILCSLMGNPKQSTLHKLSRSRLFSSVDESINSIPVTISRSLMWLPGRGSHVWRTHTVGRCVYRASYCNVLITNEMHNSSNQFLFHSFLSALHVSNESSRSSSGARHNILYYTAQLAQSCYQASLAASN